MRTHHRAGREVQEGSRRNGSRAVLDDGLDRGREAGAVGDDPSPTVVVTEEVGPVVLNAVLAGVGRARSLRPAEGRRRVRGLRHQVEASQGLLRDPLGRGRLLPGLL